MLVNEGPVAQSSAEEVVTHFYASLMQEDESTAMTYVAPEYKGDVQEALDSIEEEGWIFNEVKVLSTEGNEVTVSFDITVEGENDTGTDQVEVLEQDGKWWIVEISR